MATTRRTQLLMEPEEFKRLQRLARRRKTSVADLIRSAVRQAYLAPRLQPGPIIDAILGMRLPVADWKRARKDIEAEHARLS